MNLFAITQLFIDGKMTYQEYTEAINKIIEEEKIKEVLQKRKVEEDRDDEIIRKEKERAEKTLKEAERIKEKEKKYKDVAKTPIEKARYIVENMSRLIAIRDKQCAIEGSTNDILRIQFPHDCTACYCVDSDSIFIPKRETFDSEEEYFSVMFHEIIHGTGSQNRLNRWAMLIVQEDPLYGFFVEEFIAEFGSAFLCHYVGLEENQTFFRCYIANHQDYIEHRFTWWLQYCKKYKAGITFNQFALAEKYCNKNINFIIHQAKTASEYVIKTCNI